MPGQLVLKVDPWAVVILDGRNEGAVVGARVFSLPPGRHTLRFERNGLINERVVRVRPGRSLEERYGGDSAPR